MSHYPDWSGFDWDGAKFDDPCLIPGNPYEVALLGKRMQDVAAMIDTQARNLRNLVDGTGWDSDAGKAFQKKVGDTADLLQKSHTRYAAVGSALGSTTQGSTTLWASGLEDLQGRAKTALENGRKAHSDSAAHQKKIQGLPDDASAADAKKLKDQKAHADGDLLTWQKALEHLIDARDKQAGDAARSIRDAIDHDGLKNPKHHWWDGWKDVVADIGHWAGVAAAFLGVAALLLSWVPVLGEVLGALALIASVVALVADTISALDGKGTWLDVAIDAIGVLSFGAGRVLGEGAKAAEVAAKGADTIEEAKGAVALLREGGLTSDEAWDVVSAVKGEKLGDALLDVARGPEKLLPDLKSVVSKSLDPRVAIQAIKDSSQEWEGLGKAFSPKNAAEYFKGASPFNTMKDVINSPFKTLAVTGNRAFLASQTLPLLAGWSNLAATDEGSNPLTGIDALAGLKDLPVIGAGGIPGVNWTWSHPAEG